MTTCPACGFAGDHDGPAHANMSPTPACWARNGEVLAREYSDRAYWQSHRLLTDAYCGQHSIGTDRRARQSLYLHLAALLLHYEDGVPEDQIVAFLRTAAKSGHDFPHLQMPEASLGVTIDAIHTASNAQEHTDAVDTCARAVLAAWAPHHATLSAFIKEVSP